MVFMFFAFSAFAICVAQISQTFFKFSERRRAFNDDMAAVRMHLRKIKIGDQLQARIKSYIRHLFDVRTIGAREQALLTQLPAHLQRELVHIKLADHFEKLEIFSQVSFRALQLVSDMTVIREMAPGDVCSIEDTIATAMWVLTVGRLKIQSETHMIPEEVLQRRISVVDEETLITAADYYSEYTVVCVSSCTCLRIEKAKFITKTTMPNVVFWGSSNVCRSSGAVSRGKLTRAKRGNSLVLGNGIMNGFLGAGSAQDAAMKAAPPVVMCT
jgi:hypothetical protein